MGKGRQKGTETSVTHVEGLLDHTKSRYYPEGSKVIDRKAACVRFGYKNVGQAEGRGQRQRDLGSCAILKREMLDLDGRSSVQGEQELKFSERKANLGRDDVIERGAGGGSVDRIPQRRGPEFRLPSPRIQA